ncbi:MAG: 2-dehydropantoate 2-reductase [Bacteroidales bacterium]|nr:MAG: 2-dehydropantoate 2-reductase [Bacteroidales bacterium]
MKICFFGVGGVGGYFGALVADKLKNKHEIFFIARGSHKDAICSNGLTLIKAGDNEIINVTPEKCTDTVNDLPVCDIVVLSVKAYDLENAAKEISKITKEKTIILPLLNGVDIYERIREHLDTGIVLQSCVFIGTHIESPGVIYQKGGTCKISIGADQEFPDFDLSSLITLLSDAGINFELEENVKIPIWSKYIFIAAYGLVTASFDKTLGEILENTELSQTVKSIMYEIEMIARKFNIPLDDDIVEKSFLIAKEYPYETKTSFQRDVETKGAISEGDIFGGTLLRYGEELKIPIPTIKNVYEALLRKIE